MAMIDFQKEAKQPNYRIEHDVERLIFKEVLKLALDDSNSEVKNMSVQWWVLDPFAWVETDEPNEDRFCS